MSLSLTNNTSLILMHKQGTLSCYFVNHAVVDIYTKYQLKACQASFSHSQVYLWHKPSTWFTPVQTLWYNSFLCYTYSCTCISLHIGMLSNNASAYTSLKLSCWHILLKNKDSCNTKTGLCTLLLHETFILSTVCEKTWKSHIWNSEPQQWCIHCVMLTVLSSVAFFTWYFPLLN